MSLTPGSVKLNSFGNAINKSLLTPCRRVGLSKKKTTSNSITKSLSHDFNNSNSSISGNTPNSSILENTPNSSNSENTPNNKSVCIKRKNRSTCDRSAEINSQTIKPKKVESSRVKKNLDHCFEKDAFDVEICKEVVQCKDVNSVLPNKEITCLENQLELSDGKNKNSASFRKEGNQITQIEDQSSHLKSAKLLALSENIHNKNDVKSGFEANNIVIKTAVQDLKMYEEKDALNISTTDQINMNNNCSPVQYPPKSNILYQTDDNFEINKNIQNNLKTYERKKTVDTINYLGTEITNIVKDCSINLQRLSEEDITISEVNTNKKIDMISSDEEDVFVVKKRKKTELFDDDEDDDFQGFTKKLIKTKKVVEKQYKNKDSTKVKRNKIPKVTSFTVDNSFEDEDDAFTSTPDREKYELISKIKVLEKIVNDKKIKLDNLKRAALYKAKHNIEELKNVTDIWRHGCTLSLEGLLKQLQTHGPMDMSILLKNLQISDEVTSKLFNVI